MFCLILVALILTQQSVCFGKFSAKQLAGIKSTNFNGNSPIALWMQQSGVAVRICQRVMEAHSYNSGLSPKTAQITIGRCQAQLVSSTENVTAKQQVCPGIQACSPTMLEVIPLRTDNGIKEVSNALDCTCSPLHSECKRRPFLRSFYQGTKYERVIDVGKCAGNCQSKKCQPLSIKTVAIKTPNGRKEVKVIEKCGCESPCYRMSYKKAYSVISSSDSGHTNKTHTKVIDIGMCSGSASCPGKVQGKCLYWASLSNKRMCVIHTGDRPKGCYAEKTRTLFLNTTVTKKEVNIIDSCACT